MSSACGDSMEPATRSKPVMKPPRKSMSSGVKRTAAPQVPAGAVPSKKPADAVSSANGRGPAPLTYSSGEPADDVNMNEVDDKVTLEVFLPSGKSSSVTVDSNIPMLDLLVHLAGRCKVSPSGHVLQLMDEETDKPIDFKPHQTIGSLGVTSVHIAPKNKKHDWGSAYKATKVARTFEITNRFTINLPGGQKAVMRISPQMTLEQVLARVCQDKSLDSRRYTFQHPAGPSVPLNLKATIADSKLSEINLIHAGGASAAGDGARHTKDFHRSTGTLPASSHPPPASQDPNSWYMPTAGETKKKKGFLSFLTKKDKKFKLDSHHNVETSSTASHQVGSAVLARRPTTPPPERRSSDAAVSGRPKSMFVTSHPEDVMKEPRGASPKAPPRGGGKKRPAPPPPQAKASPVASAAASTQNEDIVKATVSAPVAAGAPPAKQNLSVGDSSVSVSVKGGVEAAGVSKLHSRNSSDSSGYHELTLSGAESPEASRLPTAFKTSIDTTSIESSDNLNGDSGIQDMSPGSDGSRLSVPGDDQLTSGRAANAKHQPQTHSLERVTDKSKPSSSKKKKAPPPPPKAIPEPVQEETSEVITSATELPCTQMASSIPEAEAEEPPPPLTLETPHTPETSHTLEASHTLEQPHTLEVDVTDSGVGDVPTERNFPEADDEDQSANASSEQAFDLDDILNSIEFDEEPRRNNTTKPSAITITTTSFPEDDEPGDSVMAMEETSSVVSEDAEVPEDVRLRPCEFIPPPPPDEPPPEDYSPRGSGPRYADKATVVGDDNTSLAPASRKNSPVATRLNRSPSGTSLASQSSVDSIESLSLAFEQTIAAGQEALDGDQWREGESGYTDRLQFDTDLNGVTADNPSDSGNVSSDTTSLSLPEIETDGATEVTPLFRVGLPRPTLDDFKDTVSSTDRHGESSPVEVDRVQQVEVPDTAFTMTEEIHAPVETVPPPLQFQTDKTLQEDEEEEEEEVTTVTEEFVVPIGPNGLDYSAAVKVSEEKETSVLRKNSNNPRTVVKIEPEPEPPVLTQQDVVEEKPSQPAEKEEFVLTMEDLSSVSLVPLRPKVYIPPKHIPTTASSQSETDHSSESVIGGSPQRSHVHLAYVSDHGHIHPVSQSVGIDRDSERSQARSLHFISEKNQVPETLTLSERDHLSESSTDSTYRSTAKLLMAGEAHERASADRSNTQEDADSHHKENAFSPNPAPPPQVNPASSTVAVELQQQYSTLQDQFAVWQEQLQQNQTLLAASSSGIGKANDETLKALQMQMQVQQQMMQQLQTSMQALVLQQQQQQNNVRQDVSGQQAYSSAALSSAPPPPPAPATTVIKSSSAKVKTRPAVSRFEPQLDPREELMIAIRSFGGLTGLKTVPVKQTKWVPSAP